MTGEGKQREQGREEQKFFPIITRQNKFDELLVQCGVNNMTIKSS
jgi:hypothetical protein